MQYNKASPLARSKELRDDGTIVEIVIWQVTEPVWPCSHPYKYRLFFGKPGDAWVRYDNERGKGDHKHVGGVEHAYHFESLDKLLSDFEHDMDIWRPV